MLSNLADRSGAKSPQSSEKKMAAEADANDERLMRRAIAESRLAVEEDNAMVRYECMFDSLVLQCPFATCFMRR